MSGPALQDRSNDRQLATAVRTVLEAELEGGATEKATLYSGDVAPGTRLTSRAQRLNTRGGAFVAAALPAIAELRKLAAFVPT